VRPGDAASSPFVTDLLRGQNAMREAFESVGPDGRPRTETAGEWIDAGCPVVGTGPARPLTLLSPPERLDTRPTGEIHGTGSVH
jgi:hypothetical protein